MKRAIVCCLVLSAGTGLAACGTEDPPPAGGDAPPLTEASVPAPAPIAADDLASLRAGPRDAAEEAAFGFVNRMGRGGAMRSHLEFLVLQSPPLRALMPEYGLPVTGPAEKAALEKAIADFQPLWNLSIARAYLTEFSVEELQSIERDGTASPHYDRYQRAQPAIAFAARKRNDAILDAAYEQVVADATRAITGE